MDLPRRASMSPAIRVRRAASLVAAAILVLGVSGTVGAQAPSDPAEPSPAPSPATSPNATVSEVLFLQTWATGRLEPADGGEVVVRLSRASGQTMYIAETPEHRVGTLSSIAFLERLVASLAVPPKAAVLGQRSDGGQVLVAGQVLEGRQVDRQSFEYRLRLLPDDVDIGLEVDAERLVTLTEPLDLQLSYILFTAVEGCSPWETIC